MANTKEIKNRIKSVRDTQKITNAMYLIASTKMRRAKNELDATRPYFDTLKGTIKNVFSLKENVESRYFRDETADEIDGTYGYLVITADKGLAGAYNQNVINEAMKTMTGHKDNRIFVVGEYGRRYFMSKRIPIDEDFNYLAPAPTLARAREMSSYLMQLFRAGEITRLFVVYTDFKNGISGGNPVTFELLPFTKADFTDDRGTDGYRANYEYLPGPREVLESIVPSYMMGFIYSALVDSFCSEQNARMTAMDSANQNAEEILEHLSVEYNHLRQGAITQEITEVSSGARAKKKNLNKREVALNDR